MVLARAITRSKWRAAGRLGRGEIPAGAVTADLRTQDNALSFWRCGDAADSSLERAALAIAAGRQRVEKVEIVWISEEEARDAAMTLEETEGRTPARAMRRRHLDIYRLDHRRLGTLAERVAHSLRRECWLRVSKPRIRALLREGIREGEIDADALPARLKADLTENGRLPAV